TSAANTVTVNNQVVQSGPWAKAFGGSSSTLGYAVAVEASTGNIIVAGTFNGTTDFGAGLLTSIGGGDMFLAKYSATGVCLWSRSFGSTGSEMPKTVVVDSSGNIFVAGNLQGITTDVGGGTMTSFGNNDVFLAKYSSAGQPQWAKHFAVPGSDVLTSMAIDPSGNIILTGTFQSMCGSDLNNN